MTNSSQQNLVRCGYVAIVGRPNVGKSTLLNNLLGQKLSITSSKPQTTMHQILGIKTNGLTQSIFIDTPGIHRANKRTVNKRMNKAAIGALEGVDLILMVVERHYWNEEDEDVLKYVKQSKIPTILIINKIDQLKNKEQLIHLIAQHNQRAKFEYIVPIDALHGSTIALENTINTLLPEHPHLFEKDQISDRNDRFFVAHFIREKLIRILGDELPHELIVTIDTFEVHNHGLKGDILHIDACIWVNRASQKMIVIGQKGVNLKKVGLLSRQDIEHFLDQKIMLNLWVKVKSNWMDNANFLETIGF